MIYAVGTVSVTQGSILVSGSDATEFLKYVSAGDLFSIDGETVFYIISSIIDQNTFRLASPYLGITQTDVAYSINDSQTPNLGLPLLSKNDPDTVNTVNNAFFTIDRRSADFLSYTPLKSVTYSGENGFFIDGHHPETLAPGRVVKLVDSNDAVIAIDEVQDNTWFNAFAATTMVAKSFTYSNAVVGSVLSVFDVLHNVTQNDSGFVSAVDTTTITLSGELQATWRIGDEIKVFGRTRSRAKVQSYNNGTVILEPFNGETLFTTDFPVGSVLYNQTKRTEKTIISRSYGSGGTIIGSIASDIYTDNWETEDWVYTAQSKIRLESNNLSSAIATVKYGAKANVQNIKSNQIKFGFRVNEVNADKIPAIVSGVSGETVTEVLAGIQQGVNTHQQTHLDAHVSTAIPYTDNPNIGPAIISSNHNGAINELKARFNSGIMLSGTVDEGYTTNSFVSNDYMGYPGQFFANNWYCIFDTGANMGEIQEIDSCYNGNFITKIDFSFIPQEGDNFRLIAKTVRTVDMGNGLFEVDDEGDVMPLIEVLGWDPFFEESGDDFTMRENPLDYQSGSGSTVITTHQLITSESNVIDFTAPSIIQVQADSPGIIAILSDIAIAAKECQLIGKSNTNYVIVSGENILPITNGTYTLKEGDIVKFTWSSSVGKFIETFSRTSE